MFDNRVFKLIRRKVQANRLGIHFSRQQAFVLGIPPASLRLNGRKVEINLPQEIGVATAFIEILMDDCYGLDAMPTSVQTVLDVGANVGLFGLAARAHFPKALIHAYEPNQQLEPYLSTQARAANFVPFLEAVGLEEGRAMLMVGEDSLATRSRTSAQGSVQQTAFREAISRMGGCVDLLKLDCEGAEWEIFKDVEAWRSVRCVSMEYHLSLSQTHTEARQAVIDLGFAVRKCQVMSENLGVILGVRKP